MLITSGSTSVSKRDRANRPPSRARFNIIAAFILIVSVLAGLLATASTKNPLWLILGALFGGVFSQSPRVAQQWERGVVLRLGRYIGLRGPGLFWVLPFFDKVSSWIDQRVLSQPALPPRRR